MIRKAVVIFCDNEHGSGDVCFPDLTSLSGFEFQQRMIACEKVGEVRREAKAAGWGLVDGVDYCPACFNNEKERTEA